MTKLIFSTTLVACAAGWLATTAFAQNPVRPTSPVAGPPSAGAPAGGAPNFSNRPPVPTQQVSSPVAVIDLLHIFENHPGFQQEKAQMDRMKEAREQELIQKRDALKALVTQLKEMKPGTPEFSQIESKAAQDEAALQVAVKKANQEFIMAEGKMYYTTYKAVLDEVKWYASQRNILVVLRYTGKSINAENPEEIMKEMNEQVVHFHQGVDITNDILNQIKSKSFAPRMSAQPGQPGVQRPAQR